MSNKELAEKIGVSRQIVTKWENDSGLPDIENLIKAKGFEDVIVSASSNTINVIVETNGLTNAEVAQIVDVVKNNSDYSIDNIKITEV